MATVIKVQWDNGKPCHGTRVTYWTSDANREVMSNSDGEAYFDYGPGHGTIYCDGQEVFTGDVRSGATITCREAGLFSYKYY